MTERVAEEHLRDSLAMMRLNGGKPVSTSDDIEPWPHTNWLGPHRSAEDGNAHEANDEKRALVALSQKSSLHLAQTLITKLPRELRDLIYESYWRLDDHSNDVQVALNGLVRISCNIRPCSCWSQRYGATIVNPNFVGIPVAEEAMTAFLAQVSAKDSADEGKDVLVNSSEVSLRLMPELAKPELLIKVSYPTTELPTDSSEKNVLQRYLITLEQQHRDWFQYQDPDECRARVETEIETSSRDVTSIMKHFQPYLSLIQIRRLEPYSQVRIGNLLKKDTTWSLDIAGIDREHSAMSWAEEVGETLMNYADLFEDDGDENCLVQ